MELSSYRLKQGLNFSMADGASSYAVCIMAAEINSSQQGQGQLKMSMERNKKHIMRFLNQIATIWEYWQFVNLRFAATLIS